MTKARKIKGLDLFEGHYEGTTPGLLVCLLVQRRKRKASSHRIEVLEV